MKFDVPTLDVYSHSEYLKAVSESGIEKEDVFGSDTEVNSEVGIKDEVEPLVKVLIKTLLCDISLLYIHLVLEYTDCDYLP